MPAILRGDSQMIDVTAPTIVTTEYGTDESSIQTGDRADAWIAFQKRNQHLGSFLVRQANALGVLPEIKSCGYVGGNHGSDGQELFKSCEFPFANHRSACAAITKSDCKAGTSCREADRMTRAESVMGSTHQFKIDHDNRLLRSAARFYGQSGGFAEDQTPSLLRP